MKKLITLLGLMVLPTICMADWSSDMIKSAGNRVGNSAVTIAANSTGTVVSGIATAVNTDIFNNSAYTLWIGSTAAVSPLNGFPILASATYTLDGRFTGSIIGYAGAGEISVRVLQYITNKQ